MVVGRLDKKVKPRDPVVRDKKGSDPFASKKLVSPHVTDEEKRLTSADVQTLKRNVKGG